MNDISSILFPDDAPKPASVPEYVKAQQAAAEARLMGSQKRDVTSERASAMFPGEAQAAPAVAQDKKADIAETLFGDDAKKNFDTKVVSDFMDAHMLGAFSEGDRDRVEALKAATSALTDDFRRAGTDSGELKAAFDILREANDFIVPPTPEKIEADMIANLATLQGELGASFEKDIAAARAFVRDLEAIAPGTIASLEHNGAGNSIPLVKSAMREALRRGYGSRQ